MNKKITLIFVIVILIISGCAKQADEKQPDLKFSIEKCYEDVGPTSEVPADGILNNEWVNEDTMLIEGFVKTYCGGAEITGDYGIEGNNIILKYNIEIGQAITRCICLHKLIYEISNLEHKDYSISMFYPRKISS